VRHEATPSKLVAALIDNTWHDVLSQTNVCCLVVDSLQSSNMEGTLGFRVLLQIAKSMHAHENQGARNALVY
jgi:hypothetical protein